MGLSWKEGTRQPGGPRGQTPSTNGQALVCGQTLQTDEETRPQWDLEGEDEGVTLARPLLSPEDGQ